MNQTGLASSIILDVFSIASRCGCVFCSVCPHCVTLVRTVVLRVCYALLVSFAFAKAG